MSILSNESGLVRRAIRVTLFGAALWLGVGSVASVSYAECENIKEIKRPLFGDLHVHTSYSLDAYRASGTRNDPWDAYDFAKGAPLWITSLSQDGLFRLERDKVSTSIGRRLDFAAVTDHDNFLNQIGAVCSWYSPSNDATRYCPFSQSSAWQKIRKAASDHDSPCDFTTFVAYEWTKVANGTEKDPLLASPWGQGSQLHRNVIFKSDSVPTLPFTIAASGAQAAPTPSDLWKRLSTDCTGNCEVITIPHNPNLSNGFMFPDLSVDASGAPLMGSALDDAIEFAKLQAKYEPLMEIIQHKGASECVRFPGVTFGGEEACAFEERNLFKGTEEAERFGKAYAREALKTGLALYASSPVKVNPYALGFIGSTDTHNATPGAVSESDWKGHQGALDSRADWRLLENWLPQLLARFAPEEIPERSIRTNPGGLAVVWAKENTRAAIFEALQKREAYATSGPRITLRVFGGWNLGSDPCSAGDSWIENAYANSTSPTPSVVPMGGQLNSKGRTGKPRFFISVAKDPGQPPEVPVGANLERIEIIKGWIGSDGRPRSSRNTVFSNADPLAGDTVLDTNTCQLKPAYQSTGFPSQCLTWEDASWDLDTDAEGNKNAFYYVRVTEVPSCRWSRHDERNNPGLNAPEGVPDLIRERAWSSPIWFMDEEH